MYLTFVIKFRRDNMTQMGELIDRSYTFIINEKLNVCGEGLVWLIWAVVCLSCCAVGPLSAITGNGWLHIAPR